MGRSPVEHGTKGGGISGERGGADRPAAGRGEQLPLQLGPALPIGAPRVVPWANRRRTAPARRVVKQVKMQRTADREPKTEDRTARRAARFLFRVAVSAV